jgi:hypothetical protein
MFYAQVQYWNCQEKTKFRFFVERKQKNEKLRSQKNETLTSLIRIRILT